MARRMERGAGIAAAVLSLLTLAVVLLAPLVAVCPAALDARGHCPAAPRYVSLLSGAVRVDASVWVVIGLMLIVSLVGAAGAVLDSSPARQGAVVALWSGAGLAGLGWIVLLSLGGALGPLYLPPVLALGIAAFAAARRLRTRRIRSSPPHDTPAPPPDAPERTH